MIDRMAELNAAIASLPAERKRTRHGGTAAPKPGVPAHHVERIVSVDPTTAKRPICCDEAMDRMGMSAGAARFRCRKCKRYVRVDPVERYCPFCNRKKHLARACCWICQRKERTL